MKNAKNYKRLFILSALTLMCAVLFAGCSESGENWNNSGGNYAYYESSNYADYNNADEPEIANMTAPGYALLTSLSDNSASNAPTVRKIIRDADVTMEVEDVDAAFENILNRLEDSGGYEASRDMSVDYDKIPTVHAVFKIPAEDLDWFLAELKAIGDIKSSSISSSDITDQYYDSQTRLTTLEKTLEKYYEFLDNAQNVEEQLEVTRYINDLTSEIEQIKGSLKRWDALVAYSTISLNLYKIYEAPEEERIIEWSSLSFDDMWWLISSGFITTCSVIVNVLQRIFIVVIAGLPIIIPLGVVLFFGIRYQRKQAKKRQQAQQTQIEKAVNVENTENKNIENTDENSKSE